MSASPPSEELPDDPAALRALILAERARHAAEIASRDNEVARLAAIIKKLQRGQFGKSSEKLDPDQLQLALDDVEAAIAAAEAEEEDRNATLKAKRLARDPVKRAVLPPHLPRVEIIVDVEDKTCP